MPRCPLLLTVFSLLLLAMARPTKAQGIRLRNLEDGATLRYPAPILQGTNGTATDACKFTRPRAIDRPTSTMDSKTSSFTSQ